MRTHKSGAYRPFGYQSERRRRAISVPAPQPPLRGEAVPLSLLIRRAHGVAVRLADRAPAELVEIGRGTRPVRRGYSGPISVFVARFVAVGAFVGLLLVGASLGWNVTQEGHAAGDEPALAATAPNPGGDVPSPLLMGPVSTGVPAVDDALRGFLTGDIEAAFAELVIREVPCGVPPWGGVPVLVCAKGEAPGAVHQLILSGCEPGWTSPKAAKAELATLLAVTPGVYSVARSGRDYVTVLAWPDAPERSLSLGVSSLGITSYAAGCGVPMAAKPGYALKFVPGGNP
jgi:hypothetical protein